MKAISGTVEGLVQGVCFRYYTREMANDLGLSGWIRNLPDGRVEFYAEGETDAVDQLARWLEEGPPAARVHRLNLEETASRRETGAFRITR